MNYSSSLILDSIFFRVPKLSILEGAYLKIIPGRITALIGRNGAGKSTLLKIAAGQIHASSGITVIDGLRIHSKSVYKRFKKISYLPQNSMLPDYISVNRLINSFPSSNIIFKYPIINKIRKQKVDELSTGERKFLEVFLLFSLDRKYILLDEPFTGVEPRIVDIIIERIKYEAKKGKGILLTDHLHRYISKVADEAYLLHNKQCYYMDGNFTLELRKLGYLR